jgi:hypothetical protein
VAVAVATSVLVAVALTLHLPTLLPLAVEVVVAWAILAAVVDLVAAAAAQLFLQDPVAQETLLAARPAKVPTEALDLAVLPKVLLLVAEVVEVARTEYKEVQVLALGAPLVATAQYLRSLALQPAMQAAVEVALVKTVPLVVLEALAVVALVAIQELLDLLPLSTLAAVVVAVDLMPMPAPAPQEW